MRRAPASISLTALILVLATANGRADYVSTFEDFNLPARSYLNNAGSAGGFTELGNFFNNSYNARFGSWSGWSISSMTDTKTAGFTNQYSSVTGSGADGSATYAVAFGGGAYINLAAGTSAVSFDVTNTTYAYLSMLNGDQFAKKFGPTDYFTLVIQGYTGLAGTGAAVLATPLTVDLAKGGSILDTWRTVELTGLGSAASLQFSFLSSDVGNFGINTPTYFALDNLRTFGPAATVPEPASLALVVVGLGCGAAVRERRRRSRRA